MRKTHQLKQRNAVWMRKDGVFLLWGEEGRKREVKYKVERERKEISDDVRENFLSFVQLLLDLYIEGLTKRQATG